MAALINTTMSSAQMSCKPIYKKKIKRKFDLAIMPTPQKNHPLTARNRPRQEALLIIKRKQKVLCARVKILNCHGIVFHLQSLPKLFVVQSFLVQAQGLQIGLNFINVFWGSEHIRWTAEYRSLPLTITKRYIFPVKIHFIYQCQSRLFIYTGPLLFP